MSHFFRTVLISILVIAVLGEVALRALSPGIAKARPSALTGRSLAYEPALFARHVFPQRAQKLTPTQGELSASGTVEYRINKYGYRGKDFDLEKKPGLIRIIVYGGSSVFDLDQPEEKDWPHRLEAALQQEGFRNVEVINAGIPRHSSIDALGRLITEGHHLQPDIVVLYTTWNDVKDLGSGEFALRRLKPYEAASNPFLYYDNPLDQFLGERSLLYCFARTQYFNWKIKPGMEGSRRRKGETSAEVNPVAEAQFKLNLELFVDAARNINAVPVLMTEASLVGQDKDHGRLAHVAEYVPIDFAEEATLKADTIIREVALAKGVALIDAKAALIEKDQPLFNDHVHLNDAGSQALAQLVKKHLLTLVPCPLNDLSQ